MHFMICEDAWRRALLAEFGVAPSTARWQESGGSALNATWRLDAGGKRWFVKVNAAAGLPMFEAEAAGLAELARAAVVAVPRPVACGSAGGAAYLALEWLEFGRGGNGAALGCALAALHRVGAPRFGWHRDNTIGTTPQQNGWCDDWCTFFGELRLAPQAARIADGGHAELAAAVRRVIAALPTLLAGHTPLPSLLHGDLWSGNVGVLANGEPVIFDPAVYYGDREADLAMTELFGGFGRDFYAAYEAAWPLPPGYPRRRQLYNLYHVLNHANLLEGGYVAQARAMVDALLAGR